jgi:subtilisin-like proprotein convertase family protein
VSTTLPSSSGLNPFFGTSAAAPHAGAVAALLKSAVPSASTTKIRNALKSGALDIGAPGTDRDTGAGIISAFNSLEGIGAKASVFLELGAVTITGTGTGGSVNPGSTGTVAVQLINNGGASAGVVRGTLTSPTPGVTITTGTATWPNIGPGAAGTNSPPFAFSVGPAVPCGTRLAFHLSVTFSGRGTSPAVFDFTVQTGHASSTHVVTSYAGAAVSIPDNDVAGVNVPLTVSGVGSLATLAFSLDGTACSTAIGATTVGVDHTWVGDLVFNLTSPSGTTVTLMNRPGGTGNSGNNFCQTKLVDGAASSIQTITSAGAPWTGTFAPASPEAAFAGENATGTWVLNVSDHVATDTGHVRAFSLDATTFSCTP